MGSWFFLFKMRRTITHLFSSFGSTSLLALFKSLKYKYIFLHIDTIVLAARAQAQPWQSERDLKPTFVTRLAQHKNRHFDLCTWNTFYIGKSFLRKLTAKCRLEEHQITPRSIGNFRRNWLPKIKSRDFKARFMPSQTCAGKNALINRAVNWMGKRRLVS